MDFLNQYLPSNDVVALLIASLIFIVSVAFVAKKLLNFLLAVVLLFIAIASGTAIVDNELVRPYFQHVSTDKEAAKATAASAEQSLEQIRDELVDILNKIINTLQPSKDQGQQPNTSRKTASIGQSDDAG